MWVLHYFEDVDFSGDTLDVSDVDYFVFFKNFDGHLFITNSNVHTICTWWLKADGEWASMRVQMSPD